MFSLIFFCQTPFLEGKIFAPNNKNEQRYLSGKKHHAYRSSWSCFVAFEAPQLVNLKTLLGQTSWKKPSKSDFMSIHVSPTIMVRWKTWRSIWKVATRRHPMFSLLDHDYGKNGTSKNVTWLTHVFSTPKRSCVHLSKKILRTNRTSLFGMQILEDQKNPPKPAWIVDFNPPRTRYTSWHVRIRVYLERQVEDAQRPRLGQGGKKVTFKSLGGHVPLLGLG